VVTGYFDVFKKAWVDLVAPQSFLVAYDGSMELSARVKLLV